MSVSYSYCTDGLTTCRWTTSGTESKHNCSARSSDAVHNPNQFSYCFTEILHLLLCHPRKSFQAIFEADYADASTQYTELQKAYDNLESLASL